MRWAVTEATGPVAIRYPRGATPTAELQLDELPNADICNAVCVKEGRHSAMLCFGAIGNAALEAAKGTEAAVYNMRSVKPLDTDTLDKVMREYDDILTIEDGMIEGGAGSAVLAYMTEHGYKGRMKRLGVDNRFVPHGKPDELYHLLKLDAEGIRKELLRDDN